MSARWMANLEMTARWRTAGLMSVVVTLAVTASLVALLGNGALLAAAPTGLTDPGALTRYGLPAAQVVRDLALAMTVGSLMMAATLMSFSASSTSTIDVARRYLFTIAGVASAVWALSAVTVLALTFSEITGVSVFSSGAFDSFDAFASDLPQGRALLANAVVAGATCVATLLSRGHTAAFVLAIIAASALWPLASTGHAAGQEGHGVIVYAQMAHTTAMALWVGGLAALLLCRRRLDAVGWSTVASRYSSIAGWSVVVLVISGVSSAAIQTGSWSGLSSDYGLLIVGKGFLLLLLSAAGYWQRRRILPAIRKSPDTRAAFRRLASLELAVMGIAIGLAVALSRTPPPDPGVPGEDAYSGGRATSAASWSS